MPSPLDLPPFKKGDPLLGSHLQKLAGAVKRQTLQPGQFQSGGVVVTRPVGRSSSITAEIHQVLIFKTLPATTKSISVGSPVNTSTVAVGNGTLVAQCVIPIVDDPELALDGRSPTDPRIQMVNEDGETIVYDAVNGCRDFLIVAGDGAEQMNEEEPPAGTGVYNPPPLLGSGYLRTYLGEGEPPEEKEVFVVTGVEDYLIVYEATLNSTLLTTDTTVQVTPTADIWGKRPTGTRTAANAFGWEASSGDKCYVMRGYGGDVLIQVIC